MATKSYTANVVNLDRGKDLTALSYSYPTGTYPVEVIRWRATDGESYEVHRITYAGAASTSFDKAPNGSTFINSAGSAGAMIYVKSGTIGKTGGAMNADGSWVAG